MFSGEQLVKCHNMLRNVQLPAVATHVYISTPYAFPRFTTHTFFASKLQRPNPVKPFRRVVVSKAVYVFRNFNFRKFDTVKTELYMNVDQITFWLERCPDRGPIDHPTA
jgi:hypothetical protein